MKVSLNWVKDYVKLPDDMDLKRLSYDLTMSTVEVEDATDLSEGFHNMVIGVVQQVQQHPNADKLRVQNGHRRRDKGHRVRRHQSP